jgi:chemotaxis protein methyltransferase WspC
VTGAAEVLERHLGLAPGSVGDRVIASAVHRRMIATGAATAEAYLARLTADRAELGELAEEVVVPETWFFRYPESFRHLAAWAAGRRSVRVLCAPCSTGEEPYSVAVALLDAGFASGSVRVEAVDVSRRAVEAARAGVYSPTAFRETGSGPRDRYFEKTAKGFEVRAEVRQAVGFRVANMIEPGFLAGEPPFDAVFCRNLLIYLTPAARRRVVDAIDRLLAPSGVVYVGHAEPLGMLDPRFRPAGPPHAFVFGRAEKAAPPVIQPATARVGTGITYSVLSTPYSATVPTDPPPAPEEVKPVVATQPDPLHAARVAADRGDVAGALVLAERYLADHPPTAEAFALVGALYAAAGRPADAERAFTRALYLDPGHYDALVHLMILADNRGDAAAAANFRRRAARRENAR